jgi:quinol monooxygenase YgiN
MLRRTAREYYRKPEAKCTAWSYFVPFETKAGQQPVIGGLEIYTSKKALQTQVDDPVYFQPYHATVKREQLYSKPEELVGWYQAAGFVSRGPGEKEGEGVLISVTKMVCTDRDMALDVLKGFTSWVDTNEPGVLTYATFTRPKAPDELLLFVRYGDDKAMQAHNGAPEHVTVVYDCFPNKVRLNVF